MMIPNIWENKKCSKPPTRVISIEENASLVTNITGLCMWKTCGRVCWNQPWWRDHQAKRWIMFLDPRLRESALSSSSQAQQKRIDSYPDVEIAKGIWIAGHLLIFPLLWVSCGWLIVTNSPQEPRQYNSSHNRSTIVLEKLICPCKSGGTWRGGTRNAQRVKCHHPA